MVAAVAAGAGLRVSAVRCSGDTARGKLWAKVLYIVYAIRIMMVEGCVLVFQRCSRQKYQGQFQNLLLE